MRRNIFGHKLAWGLLISLWLGAVASGVAQQSLSKAESQPYSLEITPKLHSAGHSLYSGIYLNHHLNFEINATVKYRNFGAFLTKYADFVDTHSPVNFTSVGIFRTSKFNDVVTVTPYVGYFLMQMNSFMDRGSDMWAGLVIKFKISDSFWIDNTLLVANLLHHMGNKATLANRINAVVMIGRFRLDGYTWYTHTFNSKLHFVGASLAITSPEWKLSQAVSAKVQVAALQKVSHEIPVGAYDRGMVISLIVPIDCSPRGGGDEGNKDIGKKE